MKLISQAFYCVDPARPNLRNDCETNVPCTQSRKFFPQIHRQSDIMSEKKEKKVFKALNVVKKGIEKAPAEVSRVASLRAVNVVASKSMIWYWPY